MGTKLAVKVRQAAKRLWYFGTRYACPVCGAHTRMRHTYSFDFDVLTRLDVVGGEYVEHDDCPICFANQRIRLIHAALEKAGRPRSGDRILHVAPERALFENLFAGRDIDYVPGDLFPDRYPYIPGVQKTDITALQHADAAFDLVLCNHVLEHVPDDVGAMRELRRVLKSTGIAFLQVPVAHRLASTDEDPSIEDPAERERRFGQFDHIRIYTEADYVARLQSAGFSVRSIAVDALFSSAEIAHYQLNRRERLLVCGPAEGVERYLSDVGVANRIAA